MMKKCGALLIWSLCSSVMIQSAQKQLKRKEHPQEFRHMQDGDKKIRFQAEHTLQDSKEFWKATEHYLKQKDEHNKQRGDTRDKQIAALITMNLLLKGNYDIMSYPCENTVAVSMGEKIYPVTPCYPLSLLAYLAHLSVLQDKIITYERTFFEAVALLDQNNERRISVIEYGIIWNSPYLVEYMTTKVNVDITHSPQIMKLFINQCNFDRRQFNQSQLAAEKLNTEICTLLLNANSDLSGVTQIAPSHLNECLSCKLITTQKLLLLTCQPSSSSSLTSSLFPAPIPGNGGEIT
jgi:hypothetical protein